VACLGRGVLGLRAIVNLEQIDICVDVVRGVDHVGVYLTVGVRILVNRLGLMGLGQGFCTEWTLWVQTLK
jgi:hypothetical protein